MVNFRSIFVLTFFCNLLLSACSPPEVYSSEPLSESTIYVVDGIDNAIIQFLWLELPTPLEPGTADIRLFLAKTNPPEPIIPNPNDLKCNLSSEKDYTILGPERIPFTFFADGTLNGNYTYKACPECIECYMNWDYTLNITGSRSQESVILDIAIEHFGLNVPGSFVHAELSLASNDKEPRITCNNALECSEIEFVTR